MDWCGLADPPIRDVFGPGFRCVSGAGGGTMSAKLLQAQCWPALVAARPNAAESRTYLQKRGVAIARQVTVRRAPAVSWSPSCGLFSRRFRLALKHRAATRRPYLLSCAEINVVEPHYNSLVVASNSRSRLVVTVATLCALLGGRALVCREWVQQKLNSEECPVLIFFFSYMTVGSHSMWLQPARGVPIFRHNVKCNLRLLGTMVAVILLQ